MLYSTVSFLSEDGDNDLSFLVSELVQEAHMFDDRLPVPDWPRMWLEHAHCLLQSGRLDECVELCDRALQMLSEGRAPVTCTKPVVGKEPILAENVATTSSLPFTDLVDGPGGKVVFHFYRATAQASLGRYDAALEDAHR